MDLKHVVEQCAQRGVQVSTEIPDAKQYTSRTAYGFMIEGDLWGTAAGINSVVESIVQVANHSSRWHFVGQMIHNGTVASFELQEFVPVA
jgi:hypothetical protein